MTSQPGTYVLVLSCGTTGSVKIGSRGTLLLSPGFYLYVGSAFGSGGLQARLRHHAYLAIRPHWHIDYLRAACDLEEIWLNASADRYEHTWAKAVARLPGAELPLPGFGSSDCDCETHLFFFARKPSIQSFRRLAKLRQITLYPKAK